MVLVGPSASGKSSVLRAVALCLGGGSELGAINVRDFSDASQPLLLEVVLDELDGDDRAAFPDEVDVTDGATVTVRVKATVDPLDPDATMLAERPFPFSGHTRRPSTAQLQRFGFAFIPATRSLGRELAGAQGVARRLLTGLDMTADGPALVAAQSALRDALAASSTIGDFREQLAARLTEALPRPVTKDDVQLVMSSDPLESPLAGTTLTLNDVGTTAPLHEQSDGLQALSVLTLMAMLATESHIVAMDEPETHLHPTAQRTLVGALMAGPTQRLLVSHSSAVASAAEPQHIVTLGADGRVRQLPVGAAIGAPLRLLRDWRQALVEPLTARLIVLVEGACDRTSSRRLLNCLGTAWTSGMLSSSSSTVLGVSVPPGSSSAAPASISRFVGHATTTRRMTGLRRSVLTVLISMPRDSLCCSQTSRATTLAPSGWARVLELIQAAGLISERKLLGKSGKTDASHLTPDELGDACRRSKTAAAVSLAVGLTAADVGSLTVLADFVRSLER